jgi:carboxypeptidase C (cathepsin A)
MTKFVARFIPLLLLIAIAPASLAQQVHPAPAPVEAVPPGALQQEAAPGEEAAPGQAAAPAVDEAMQNEEPAEAEALVETGAGRLPPASVTQHELVFDDRTLRFTATAGSLTLTNAQNQAEADIAYVVYSREGDDPAARPVTFAVNGGPGAASAYLHLGVLGPWRLPMGVDNIVPSQDVALVPNAETWLDFTDLVFIDPVGTGFSRLVDSTDRLRNRYLSIDGDAEALSDFISRWLGQNGRMNSPKYFIGESYGGFRGPLIAQKLQTDHGVGLSGMTLLSPVLDFGWREQPGYAPLPRVSLLPSLAAANMERRGEFSQEALRAAEAYAAGEYLVDFMRGVQDDAAVARMSGRVADLIGLDEDLVRRNAGRIDMQTFSREFFRDRQMIASLYDAGVLGDDPTPETPFSRGGDPVLDAMTAPLTSAMLAHYRETLNWLPDRRYLLLNRGISRAWNWGGGRSQPEAVSQLRQVLALDRSFRLLVVHGYTDLVTPYFESELILRQIRDFGGRVRLENYRGGHMFYTREQSRREFMEDGMKLYERGRPVRPDTAP